MIEEPTHILDSSSFIDLIFPSLPNLIIDSRVHSSLHPNCHHPIVVYVKLKLEATYTPPCFWEVKFKVKFSAYYLMMTVWQYKDANTELIQRAVNGFNWTRTFWKASINKKVNIFNNTILKILSNFIPRNIFTCNYKDPPWFYKKTKGINQEKDYGF